MENSQKLSEGNILTDEELKEVSGGRRAVRKFKCSRCGKISMVVKFKKFVCTECGFERPM